MALFYILGCLIILAMTVDTLLDTLVLILRSTFTGQAAGGGFAGATVWPAGSFPTNRVWAARRSCCGRPDQKQRQAGADLGQRHLLGYGGGL